MTGLKSPLGYVDLPSNSPLQRKAGVILVREKVEGPPKTHVGEDLRKINQYVEEFSLGKLEK